VEMAFVAAWLAARAQGADHLPLRRALQDDMIARVGQPYVALAVELQLVWRVEQAFAPRPEECSVRLINLDGRIRPGKNPNVVLGVHRDAGHGAPANAWGTPGPSLIHLVRRGHIDSR